VIELVWTDRRNHDTSGVLTMRSQSMSRPIGVLAWIAALLFWPGLSDLANAQNFGMGASPGRGAYRPQGLWNGPFYSAPHVNPWSPGSPGWTGLISSEPSLPPYGNAPRGVYSSYSGSGGTTYPYQEGFSPYSGYADWYVKANGIKPSAEDVVAATRAFFRSSPIPPNPAYLAPSVNAAFAEVAEKANRPPARPIVRAKAHPKAKVVRSRTAEPRPPASMTRTGRVVIHRGVGGQGR
ncbi:MAG: hypothetical protein AB7I30_06105, partial [Isosphaeraceae bacterium]